MIFLLWFSTTDCVAQSLFPHPNAHAHNDYEHIHPLMDALRNGFISVEADVHLRKGRLLVAHNHASDQSPSLEKLYLAPLDSILKTNRGHVYPAKEISADPFYLMIDVKTETEATFYAIQSLLFKYPELQKSQGPVVILISGNRPISILQNQGSAGVAIDGRPADLGKGYSSVFMPVISDHYKNQSHWNGKSLPADKDLMEIKALAIQVHSEGKKLRLWAIPDNETAWGVLLDAGVDFINTDKLESLNVFLTSKGL